MCSACLADRWVSISSCGQLVRITPSAGVALRQADEHPEFVPRHSPEQEVLVERAAELQEVAGPGRSAAHVSVDRPASSSGRPCFCGHARGGRATWMPDGARPQASPPSEDPGSEAPVERHDATATIARRQVSGSAGASIPRRIRSSSITRSARSSAPSSRRRVARICRRSRSWRWAPRHPGDVLEIPRSAGEDLHGDQVFRAHHGDRDTADLADLGAGQELLLETWAREHDVNGHPRGAVRERHDPVASTNPASGTRSSKPPRVRDLDQVVGRAGAELCDVHVSAEAGDPVEDRGLGAKQEPARAGAVERAAKVGEDVSDRLSGR